MLTFEKEVLAKADMINDLQNALLGWTDPATRKRIPGNLENAYNSIDISAYAQDPAKEILRINNLVERVMEDHLRQIIAANVEAARMFAQGVTKDGFR